MVPALVPVDDVSPGLSNPEPSSSRTVKPLPDQVLAALEAVGHGCSLRIVMFHWRKKINTVWSLRAALYRFAKMGQAKPNNVRRQLPTTLQRSHSFMRRRFRFFCVSDTQDLSFPPSKNHRSPPTNTHVRLSLETRLRLVTRHTNPFPFPPVCDRDSWPALPRRRPE